MRQLLAIIFFIALGIGTRAQCNFPNTYLNSKVKEVVVYKGQVYVLIKDKGYVQLADSTGQFQVVGYEQNSLGNYAKLACGGSVRVEEKMPTYIDNGNKPLTTSLTKGGKFLTAGASLAFAGGLSAIIISASEGNVNTSTGMAQFKFYFPLTLTTMGSGLMIIGGAKLIKAGKHKNLQSQKISLSYLGTGASFKLRF
ncbi:hypothetical protein BH09BAC1_BH09BAC1_20290 [soil metagenome]